MPSRYKAMLNRMQEKERGNPVSEREQWFLYILECADGSFYTGITKDLKHRLKVHNRGTGSRFTRVRRPVELVYKESLLSRTQALVREYRVKALSRCEKEALVAQKKRK